MSGKSPAQVARMDLDPNALKRLLMAIQRIYSGHDVTRCNATTFNASGAQCPDEVRFNITIRRRR